MDALAFGIGATFVGTMYNVHYTRKNLKTAKYIDTITTHRIKWIDTIRNEVADITTTIHFTLNAMSKGIEDKTNEYKDLKNDLEFQYKQMNYPFTIYSSSVFDPLITRITLNDLAFKFNLLKLRLNPHENTGIIKIIDNFIQFYTNGEQIFESDIQCARENATLLMAEFQMLFKKECETVTNESYGEIKEGWIKNLFHKLL